MICKKYFDDTISREEHKTTFSGLRISEMTFSNQSHFPGFFLSPESHLIGFFKSYEIKNVSVKERKQYRQAGVDQVSGKSM
jgi:hypothetical protein